MLPNYLDRKTAAKKLIRDFLNMIFWTVRPAPYSKSLKSAWAKFQPKINKQAVLIAGGPSFNADLAEAIIKNRECFEVFVINFYCLNKISGLLIPDYYVLSDPAHLNTDDINVKKKNESLFSYINKYGIKVITPADQIWSTKINPWLIFDDRENLLSKNISPQMPRGYPSNTFFKAIAIAIAMRYEKIYLLGLDYNYPTKIFVDEYNKIFLRDEHHYEVVDTDYSHIFESVAHALHWWSLDYKHFEKLSSKNIFNVTQTSLIDCFNRIPTCKFIQSININF